MKFATILLFIFLSACGGGDASSGEDGSIAEAGRRRSQSSAIKVVHYGDSTQEGGNLSNGSSPSAEAQKVLNLWGESFLLINEGIGGSTAYSLQIGKDRIHMGVPFREFMPAAAPAIIELRYHGANEYREGITQEEFGATLQRLTNISRNHGVYVILTTPSPPDPAIIGPARVQWAAESAATIRGVFRANMDIAVLCDQYRYAEEAGIITEKVDGLHSNEVATVFEGRKLARCLLRANDLRLGVAP